MELLKKISKNYLSLSFSMLMTIVMALGVGSCECGGDGEKTIGKLEINVDKDRGADVERILTIKATELTKPADFKLVAKLTSTSAAAGVVKFTINGTEYKVALGADFEKGLADFFGAQEDELKEGDAKTVQIKFEPSTEVDLTLVVEIRDSKKDEAVCTQLIEWTKVDVTTLGVTSDKNDIAGLAGEATITVENTSNTLGIKPSKVDVTFNATNEVEFDLEHAVTVSPDGSLCASGGKDGNAMLWDLNEGKHLYTLDGKDIINALSFSPNRYWLCAAVGPSVKIWDLEDKKPVDELKPEIMNSSSQSKTVPPQCISLAWSPDGQTLYAGYTDNMIRVWQVSVPRG